MSFRRPSPEDVDRTFSEIVSTQLSDLQRKYRGKLDRRPLRLSSVLPFLSGTFWFAANGDVRGAVVVGVFVGVLVVLARLGSKRPNPPSSVADLWK